MSPEQLLARLTEDLSGGYIDACKEENRIGRRAKNRLISEARDALRLCTRTVLLISAWLMAAGIFRLGVMVIRCP